MAKQYRRAKVDASLNRPYNSKPYCNEKYNIYTGLLY